MKGSSVGVPAPRPPSSSRRAPAHPSVPTPVPSFAQAAPVRPSTVPSAAQMRSVHTDAGTSRPSSSMSMQSRPVSRGPHAAASLQSPRVASASAATPAHAHPHRDARLFSFTDPRTEALFRASTGAGDADDYDYDGADPLSPGAAFRAVHMPPRAATATPHRQRAAYGTGAAMPLSPAGAFSATHSSPSRPLAVTPLTSRPSPRTEALRFDAGALLSAAHALSPHELPQSPPFRDGKGGGVGAPGGSGSDSDEWEQWEDNGRAPPGRHPPPFPKPHRSPSLPRPKSSTGVAHVASTPVAPAPSSATVGGATQPVVSSSSPRKRTPLHTAPSTRDSWLTAARASIPLQYDSIARSSGSGGGGGVPVPRSVSQIQEQTRQLMHADNLRLFKLAHASERERRDLRPKPWRAGCAIEAEAVETSAMLPDSRAAHAIATANTSTGVSRSVCPVPSSSIGGANVADSGGAPYALLSAQLTRLLAQYASIQAGARDRERRQRICDLFQARLDERRLERENSVLISRADSDSDEALASLAAAHRAALRSGAPMPPHPFGDEVVLDDTDLLDRVDDPLARMVRPMQLRVEQDVVWRQLMQKLLETPPPDDAKGAHAQPLLAPPLRFLLARVHQHYQSIIEPLGEMLHLLSTKITQEAKFASLAASSQRFAHTTNQGAAVGAVAAANASVADASAAVTSSTGGSAVAVLGSRIHSLQKQHLRHLNAQLLAEYRLSEQTSRDLQHTKDSLSARVHLGMGVINGANGDGPASQRLLGGPATATRTGVGAGGGDPDHAERHTLDWDVRSGSLTAASASPPAGVQRRYLEDELEHALADEDDIDGGEGGGGGVDGQTHYVGAVRNPQDRRAHAALARFSEGGGPGAGAPSSSAGARSDPEQEQPHLSRIDPKHARYMDGMHAFLASFAHNRQVGGIGGGASDAAANSEGATGALVAVAATPEEKDATGAVSHARQHRSAALQTLLTRPLLRMHVLSNGDRLQGRVAFHSIYYTFTLSAAENGAMVRLVQHPTDDVDEVEGAVDAGNDRDGASAALVPNGGAGAGTGGTGTGAGADGMVPPARFSPSTAEDSHSFLDVYLSPHAPPTRHSHTHKVSTRGTGSCVLDLRCTSLAEGQLDPDASAGPAATTLAQVQSGGSLGVVGGLGASPQSSLYARGTQWFLRVIGRGLRPKGFTLEFRTNATSLDYGPVLDQLVSEIEGQHRWQTSVADKMARVDRLMAEAASATASAAATTSNSRAGRAGGALISGDGDDGTEAHAVIHSSSSSSSGGHGGIPSYVPALVSMYPKGAERPPCKEAATQTPVTALHAIDVEASMRLREEEELRAREEELHRRAEERRSVVSLGPLKALFKHPLPPRNKLRVWSQSTLLKLIHNIYKAKLLSDADFALQMQQFHLASYRSTQSVKEAAAADELSGGGGGSTALARVQAQLESLVPPRKLPLSEFVFDFFHDKYGLGTLAETYLAEFMHSVAGRYLPLRRVAMFARLLGIYTPAYSNADVDFFFGRCVGTLWKWSNAHNVAMADDEQGRCVLPYFVLEDSLFDIWSVAQLQHTTRLATLNKTAPGAQEQQALAAAAAAGSEDDSASSASLSEQSNRAQEVCMVSWAQMLLGKLRPLLVVQDSVRDDPSAAPHKPRRVRRSYLMDSDEFLQVVLDHGTRSLARAVDELKQVWRRFFSARTLVAERERAERAATVLNGTSASGQAAAPSALLAASTDVSSSVPPRRERPAPTERNGLKLPDWLGVMRVEFPWLDETELFLLFFESTRSTSAQHRSADAVHLEGFLRVGLRYELLHPPVPAPIPEPSAGGKRQKKKKKEAEKLPPTGMASAPTSASAPAPAPAGEVASENNEGDSAADHDPTPAPVVVPLAQLHLTPHRLPFPTLVMPGYREVQREAPLSAAAAAAAAKSKQQQRRKGAPPISRTTAPPARFFNAGKVVWDELALARQIPPLERTPGGLRLPGAGNDSVRRPASLCDTSASLPPALSPPTSLRPRDSLRLVSNLAGLFQPLLLKALNRAQGEWAVPGAYTPEEIDRNRRRLADIFEILSDLQMHLDKRRVWRGIDGARVGAGAGAAAGGAAATKDPSRHYLDDPADSLYESDDSSSDEGGPPARGSSAAAARWSRAEWDAVVRACWSSFRALLSAVSELLVTSHSSLYAHLLQLHSPDGKAMVSTEFAGGDVHRAFAKHAQRGTGTGAKPTYT